jgi:hypothetical protein
LSIVVATLMFVLLLALAIAHLLWALGSAWPIRERAMLARTVIGVEGVLRVSRLRALGFAVLNFVAAVLALALADPIAGGANLTSAGILFGLGFAVRGAIGYTSWWRKRTPLEPFRTLDRRNYSPLCLLLGVGFFALVLMRLL